ncbi:zinc finger C2HC domain-containing protein 1A-like [Asterias rubens]|uniref:zinc finger C2HC domain-containing protein 1A-like n=1 Tax=Asterias rubens TaxID=7604 RepID=UPI001455BF73|nr:zinc finger C2HC domain-containing protein 1A-like [Asterias rubens]
MEFDAFSSSGNFERQPCSVCGRKFNPETLTKHETVCRKSELKTRQRRVFDSGKQRLQGTGASLKSRITQPGQIQAQPIKETNWRERHLDFVNSIRSARAAQKAINTGGPLPPPPPPSKNPNYIECPHCTRRFSRTAAERHISFCAQRTKTYGAPVKPLNKRAAADVSYSTTGIRKAYDNHVVRRKGSANPYAYAQTAGRDFPNMPLYSATFGGGAQEPERSYRQEFQSASSNPRNSMYNSPSQNTSRTTTRVNDNQPAKRSALSTGRSRTSRPKSSVRFSEKVDVETFEKNGTDTLPSPRPPAHPPPSYPGTNGSSSHYGTQGGYRTTKASDIRLQRAQIAGNVGIGLAPRQGGGGEGAEVGGRNSTFSWRDESSPSFETTTRLDSPRGAPGSGHSPLQNGNLTPPSPMSPGSLSPRSPGSLSPRSPGSPSPRSPGSPQSYTPPQRGGGHTPSPLSSPMPPPSQYMNSSPKHGATLDPSDGSVLAPFCYHCGTKYPVQDARFCCGCGTKRAYLSPNSLS